MLASHCEVCASSGVYLQVDIPITLPSVVRSFNSLAPARMRDSGFRCGPCVCVPVCNRDAASANNIHVQ